jgi:hypothetical protein
MFHVFRAREHGKCDTIVQSPRSTAPADARKDDPVYTSSPTPLPANHMREIPMTEERKYAVLFAATILAARPCPARDIVLAKAIEKAEMILKKSTRGIRRRRDKTSFQLAVIGVQVRRSGRKALERKKKS